MLDEKQTLKKNIVNIGAWFSANLYVTSYSLYNILTKEVVITFKLNSFNFEEALDNIIEYIQTKCGDITYVNYNHQAKGFTITTKSKDKGYSSFVLVPVVDIIEVN